MLAGKTERPRGEPFERCHPLVGTPLVKREIAGDRLLDDIADTSASLGSVDPQPPEDGLLDCRTDLLFLDLDRFRFDFLEPLSFELFLEVFFLLISIFLL